MFKQEEPAPFHPGQGLDAAIDDALSTDPLVRKVRELIKATVFESEVRKNPAKHAGDKRAAAILARLALEKRLASIHTRKLAFATGEGAPEDQW